VAWYRVVFLNLEARTSERVGIERQSDEAALAYARAAFAKRRAFTRVELWEGSRLVHQEPRGEAKRAPRAANTNKSRAS